MKTSLCTAFVIYGVLSASTMSILAQGSLTPPGAPAPTMKTLDQVQPRTPIAAAHTPGDGTNQFIINTPGSYYLTGNITGVSGKNGISINADNVTVDLNGFALIGVGGSLRGIKVPAAHRNLRVHNGSAQGWGSTGIDCGVATNSQFDHLRVSQNTAGGLFCGNGCVLSNCSAEANPGDGIATGNSCTLTACYAASNGSDGIVTGDSCTVTASTSVSNANGFNIQNRCTIIACTAVLNSVNGFFPSSYCSIKDCTASGNTANGIAFEDYCLITGNNASNNGINGFSSMGSLNRIDGNTANVNGQFGFAVGNDLVVRNNAYNNTTANYNASASSYGPVQSASSATNPWANF